MKGSKMHKNLKEARRKTGLLQQQVTEREQMTIRMPSELKQKLQSEAQKRGLGFNQLLLIIFEEWFNR